MPIIQVLEAEGSWVWTRLGHVARLCVKNQNNNKKQGLNAIAKFPSLIWSLKKLSLM
jgi:hypothetical protein